MLIELDLKEAKTLKITINQFILIKLLIDEVDIKSLLDVIPINETDINNLIEKNILTKESVFDIKDFKKLIVSDEFISLIKKRDPFDEFFELYPSSVTRSDGIKDYLRGAPSNCRKIYEKVVGKSQAKHDHMKECLKFEITNRKQNNSMQYMKRMYKWLTSEEWTLYDEFMNDKSVQKKAENIYGTTVE
jgi:hypothetical protein